MGQEPAVAVTTLRTCRKLFKYRIYPTKSQIKGLENWLDLSKELYNAALEERREAWKPHHVHGVAVRDFVIEHPDKIAVSYIEKERFWFSKSRRF